MSGFPKLINIMVFNQNNEPLSNIAVSIKLFASQKNDYNFILPLSNDMGQIVVTKEWLNQEIEKERNLFMMDYSSTLEDCEHKIQLKILDQSELDRAIYALNLFKEALKLTDDDIAKFANCNNLMFDPVSETVDLSNDDKLDIWLITKADCNFYK